MAKSVDKKAQSGTTPKMPTDVALVHGPTEDGKGAKVLRYREGTLSAGEVRPMEEGKPVGDGELVKLAPMEGTPGLCEVEVLHDNRTPPKAPRTRKQGHGPARVSNDSYRKNWNQVFSGPAKKREGDVASAAPRRQPGKTKGKWSVN